IGIYSPFETIRVWTGEPNSSTSAAEHLASCRSLSHASSSRLSGGKGLDFSRWDFFPGTRKKGPDFSGCSFSSILGTPLVAGRITRRKAPYGGTPSRVKECPVDPHPFIAGNRDRETWDEALRGPHAEKF